MSSANQFIILQNNTLIIIQDSSSWLYSTHIYISFENKVTLKFKVILFLKEICGCYITKFAGGLKGAVLNVKKEISETETLSFKSMKLITILAKIGSKNVKINTDAIDSELPLLLSRKEINMVEAKIDFDNDVIYIWTRY